MIGDQKEFLDFGELVDFLEPQPERTCVPVPGFNVCKSAPVDGVSPSILPARGPALMVSSEDFKTLLNELQQACRELGKRCKYVQSK